MRSDFTVAKGNPDTHDGRPSRSCPPSGGPLSRVTGTSGGKQGSRAISKPHGCHAPKRGDDFEFPCCRSSDGNRMRGEEACRPSGAGGPVRPPWKPLPGQCGQFCPAPKTATGLDARTASADTARARTGFSSHSFCANTGSSSGAMPAVTVTVCWPSAANVRLVGNPGHKRGGRHFADASHRQAHRIGIVTGMAAADGGEGEIVAGHGIDGASRGVHRDRLRQPKRSGGTVTRNVSRTGMAADLARCPWP